jgi:HD superfamily phosphohydrolase
MFSEAYWHHTVRSASAMMERALADYLDREAPGRAALTGLLLSRSDDALVGALVDRSPAGTTTHALLSAMSGGRRSLYKRVVTLSRVREAPEEQVAYERVYHLNAAQLDDLEARLRVAASRLAGRPVARGELLVDTPPRDKDRIETVQVVYEREGRRVALPLEQVSKVVQGIATDFIKVVKKIRVFVSPAVRDAMRERHAPESIRSGLLQTVLDYQPADEGQQRLL